MKAIARLLCPALLSALALAGNQTLPHTSSEPATERLESERDGLARTNPISGQGVFVENAGQWPDEVLFLGRVGPVQVQVREDSVWFEVAQLSPIVGRPGGSLEPHPERAVRQSIRVSIPGASRHTAVGSGQKGTAFTFLTWQQDDNAIVAEAYERVRIPNVLEGVDWILRVDDEGRPCFDFELRAGVDPGLLELEVQGGSTPRVANEGVEWRQGQGTWRFGAVEVLQESEEPLSSPRGTWVKTDSGRIGFELEGVRLDKPFTIDPSVTFTSLIGGLLGESISDIEVDSNGLFLLTGYTTSPNFPISPGVTSPGLLKDAFTIFVSRVAALGTLPVSSTLIGEGQPLPSSTPPLAAVTDQGLFLAFQATSFPAPTPGAFTTPSYPNAGSGVDVVGLSHDGDEIRFIAVLGGSFTDQLVSFKGTVSGGVLIGMTVFTADPPAQSIFLPPPASFAPNAVYVVELEPNGGFLTRSILMGSERDDSLQSLELLENGSLLIVGTTGNSTELPTTSGAFQESPVAPGSSTLDGFWARTNADWSALDYCSYLSTSDTDLPISVKVVGKSAYWIVTRSEVPELPFGPSVDVSTLDPSLEPILFLLCDLETNEILKARYAYSQITELDDGVLIDADGGLVVFGSAEPDSQFPFLTPGEPFGPPGRTTISKFDPLGDHWLWSYAYGGSLSDPNDTATESWARQLLGPERIAIAGSTVVKDLLISRDAIDTTPGPVGTSDGWFGEFELSPAGFERFGEPTNSCNGDIRAGVRRLPRAGESGFAVSCIGAPRGAPGVLVRSAGAAAVPVDLGGISVYIDLGAVVISTVQADSLGWASAELPLTQVPVGAKAFFQFAWVDPGSCDQLGALSASDALAIEVQP